MPKVPIYDQTAAGVATSEAQLRAPDVSSGLEGIATAGQQLGAAMFKNADVQVAIADMSAQTVARQQALADKQAVSSLGTQYATLQGQNAIDARPEVLKQITAIQAAGQKAMPNPLAQKYYAIHSGPLFVDANDLVNGHAFEQAHVAFGQQLGAETAAAQNDAANVYGDPARLDTALSVVATAAAKQAHFLGNSPEAAQLFVNGKTGTVVQSAILAAKANRDYDLANTLDLKYTNTLPSRSTQFGDC